MTGTMTGEIYIPETEIVPGLSIDDFILSALYKRAVDATNAGRLLAGEVLHALGTETEDKLHDVISDSNGERGPGEIIAPLLRVADDFRDEDVYIHAVAGAQWHRHAVWTVDEATHKAVIETTPGITIDINPRSVDVLPAQDYDRMLKPPAGVRRPRGHVAAFKFALGLSIFDPLYRHNIDPIGRTHRHFDLTWDPDSFRKENR